MNEDWKYLIKHNARRAAISVKWIAFSLCVGVLLGAIGAAFYWSIGAATAFRLSHPAVLYLLPFGAIAILLAYHLLHDDDDGGTNLVLSAIHSDDRIPFRMAPLIFFSTVLSHFCGASVGREGAALQLGGSLGNSVGRLFRFNDTDKKTMIMVGMSAVFSALFGTPIAASIFSMEVVSVGIMHYAALLPCVIASFTARAVAGWLGAPAPFFDIGAFPEFGLQNAFKAALLAALCGLVSILFCMALRAGESVTKKYLKNRYYRAFVLGALVLGMTMIAGDQSYNGAGIDYINACIEGESEPWGFAVKIAFTVASILAGYKGGEIVPSFFIGASFGCSFGILFGFDPSLSAAIGMGAMFCGVTNCPITALLICFELFGFGAAPYFLLAAAFSYMLSGYYGLYTAQKIVYSKFTSKYINKKTQ